MEKYQLRHDETASAKYGMKLYRIIALKDFGNVKKGEVGGLVSSEYSLSDEGSCWVYKGATVLEKAIVKNDAVVTGNAIICGNVIVQDEAVIEGNAKIYNHAVIEGRAYVSGDAVVSGSAVVRGEAIIRGKARITGNNVVGGAACIEDEIMTQEDEKKKSKKETETMKQKAEKIEERRQYLETRYQECKKTTAKNKIGGIAATIVSVVTTNLIIVFGFGGFLLAMTVLIDVFSFYVAIFCYASLFIDSDEIKQLKQEFQQLSGKLKYNLEDFCAELRELNDKISNQEVHGFVKELIQVLTESKEYEESLPEAHLMEAVDLLHEYIKLGKEKPEGYEDLTKYLQLVKESVKEIPLKQREAKEIVFAADASALVTNIKLQK